MAQKRAILFINGEVKDLRGLASLLTEGDLLVAVDGGLRYLLQLGKVPHILIGDLDSVSAEELAVVEQAGARIVRYPVEKDDTDLEMALDLVIAEGYRVIRIAAALGGRIDHALGNLFLLTKPELADVDLRLIEPDQEIFVIRGDREIVGKKDDLVSLLPLNGPAVGVTTEALYYPLRGETLYPYRTRGISNVMLGERARITLNKGILLCVHTKNIEPQNT